MTKVSLTPLQAIVVGMVKPLLPRVQPPRHVLVLVAIQLSLAEVGVALPLVSRELKTRKIHTQVHALEVDGGLIGLSGMSTWAQLAQDQARRLGLDVKSPGLVPGPAQESPLSIGSARSVEALRAKDESWPLGLRQLNAENWDCVEALLPLARHWAQQYDLERRTAHALEVQRRRYRL